MGCYRGQTVCTEEVGQVNNVEAYDLIASIVGKRNLLALSDAGTPRYRNSFPLTLLDAYSTGTNGSLMWFPKGQEWAVEWFDSDMRISRFPPEKYKEALTFYLLKTGHRLT